MRETLKQRVFRRLPTGLKPYVKLTYGGLTAPFDYPRKSNSFKFANSVLKTEQINYVPPVFIVTINSSCNLRCPNCFYVIKGGDHAFEGGNVISVDDLQTVMDKYAHYIETVWFTGGEPLAHPRLGDPAAIVKTKRLTLQVNTNGVFIERRNDVLKAFDFINVSLDGYDHESFARYRGGIPREFDRIVSGLSLLKKIEIAFSISFVLSEENLGEVDEMLTFAHEISPPRVIFHNMNPHGSKGFTPLTLGSEKVRHMLNEMTAKRDYPFDIDLPVIFDTESERFRAAVCIQQWNAAAFNDKGQLSYCCHMDHDPSIGNMFQGYDFNSEKMRMFRRQMMRHEYPEDDCLHCHRRFLNSDKFARFDSRQRRWIGGEALGNGASID